MGFGSKGKGRGVFSVVRPLGPGLKDCGQHLSDPAPTCCAGRLRHRAADRSYRPTAANCRKCRRPEPTNGMTSEEHAAWGCVAAYGTGYAAEGLLTGKPGIMALFRWAGRELHREIPTEKAGLRHCREEWVRGAGWKSPVRKNFVLGKDTGYWVKQTNF